MSRPLPALLPLVLALSIPIAAQAGDEEERAAHREKMKELIEEVAGEDAKFVGDRHLLVYVEKGSDSKEARKIRNRLEMQKVTVDFEGILLTEAIQFLRDVTGVNIVLSKEVGERAKEEKTKVTLEVKEIRFKSALNLLLDVVGKDLEWRIKNDVLFIRTKEEGEKEKPDRTFVLLDVSDILYLPPDFPAPKLGIWGLERKE